MRYVHCKNIYAHIIPLAVISTNNTQGSKQMLFFECMLMRKLDSIAKRSITLCKIANVKNRLKICLRYRGQLSDLAQSSTLMLSALHCPWQHWKLPAWEKGQNMPFLKQAIFDLHSQLPLLNLWECSNGHTLLLLYSWPLLWDLKNHTNGRNDPFS